MKLLSFNVMLKINELNNCDWACENRAYGHMIFDYFFKLPSHITFYTIMLLQCNFQVIVRISLAL